MRFVQRDGGGGGGGQFEMYVGRERRDLQLLLCHSRDLDLKITGEGGGLRETVHAGQMVRAAHTSTHH